MNQSDLQRSLAGIDLGEVRYLAATGSTNDEAMQWLESGAPDFSIVVADEQTAGRGRFQRKWITNPGTALAFSLIIHPTQLELPYIHLFSPLAGIAVNTAFETLLQLHPQIKWPNDILIDRQKVCGILSETAWTGDQLSGVVIGIGVNVSRASIPPADELTFPASSLESITGNSIDRWEVLPAILRQFASWRKKMAEEEFYTYWQDHLAFAGEDVEIRGAWGAEISGRLVGIDPSGELVIETENGEVTVAVGDVHLQLRQQ